MPHISELTDADALTAARMTGLPFDSVRRTDWGLMVMCERVPMSFCFHFKRDSFECGIPGLLTPRVDKVVDFLRLRGYVLGAEQT